MTQPRFQGYDIPFNRPCFEGDELRYITEAIESGSIAGDGAFTRRCHTLLEELLGVERALLTPSCTHALELAAILLDLAPGDEVILPSFTFVSTANAFVIEGARPIFADIRPDTLNLDETALEPLINEYTRAVVPVHYGGVACEMNALHDLAARNALEIVEDNAHGLFGRYHDRWLGTFGGMATLSFHETKNFTCGEGGALLVSDPDLWQRAEIVREKGTDRSRFFRGEVDKYTWVDIGSSYLPSDVQAAFLFAQLQARDGIQRRRERIWRRYDAALADWARANGVTRPTIPPGCDPAWHLYYLLLPTPDSRDRFIAHMKERRILAVFHYLPLHLSPMGRAFGGREGQCPVVEDTSARLVRLPFFNDMREDEQARVIDAATAFTP